MAQKIEYSDNLKKGTDKLNESIEQSNVASQKAITAEQTANQAIQQSESTQTQLDNIVIEGDSSVEAAQARVDSKGESFPTLKSRLDNFEVSATQQLQQKATKAELLQTNTELSGVDQRVDNLVIPISAENANLEVSDAHVSTFKGKTFDSLSKRFRESEEEIGYLERYNGMIENVVKHEWTAAGGTLSSEAGILTLSGLGSTNNVFIRQSLGRVGRKFYFKASVRSLSDRTDGIELLYGSNRISVKWGMTVGEWYVIEGVYDIASINNLIVKHMPFGSGAILTDEQIQVKEVMGLDLTAIFGSGNEPDITGAKSFINNLGVDHFDGKVSQYNLKDISYNAQDLPRLTESVDFFLDNKIRNGSFEKVTPAGNFTYWLVTSGASTNEWVSTSQGAKITVNSAGNPFVISQDGEVLAEHVYYVSGEIKSTIPFSDSTDNFIYMQGTYGQMTLGDVTGEFVRKSGLRIPPYSTSAYFMTLSAGKNQPVDSSVYFNNIIAIDLTEIFGAGNEPSLEEMDSLYDMIGWFEGAKTVSQSVMVKWLRFINRELENQINAQQEGIPIPSYVEDDIAIVNDKLAYNYGADFTLGFMTDIHDKTEHYKYMSKVMESGYVDGLVVNGDLGPSSIESSLLETKKYFLNHSKNIRNIRKGVYFTRGNHDGVGDPSYTNLNFTNAVIRPFVKDNVEDDGYYFVDNERVKIRMIFLNSSMDLRSRFGFGAEQVQWFNSVLMTTPSGYHVITISHHNLLPVHSPTPVLEADLIVAEIKNFIISKPDCKHVGHWFGHIHQDVLENIEGINYICTKASNGNPNTDRVNGTNSEYAIDFININTLTKTVNLVRMGHGEDRSFTY